MTAPSALKILRCRLVANATRDLGGQRPTPKVFGRCRGWPTGMGVRVIATTLHRCKGGPHCRSLSDRKLRLEKIAGERFYTDLSQPPDPP